jgi:putative heme transporter
VKQEHVDSSRVGPAKDDRSARGSRRVLRIALSVVLLVAILIGVVPQFANYSDAWRHMARIGPWWWVMLALATAVTQVSGVWLYQAALPGLRMRDGFVQISTTSAIASTLPAGGAVALGMTYRMFRSFGFEEVGISSAVIITGVWNLAAKLGLPVLAVGLLAITSHPPKSALIAAMFGVFVTISTGVGLWLVFRSTAITRWIGQRADKAANWLLRLLHRPATNHIEQSLVDFRSQTVETVHRRGWRLTGAALASQFVAVLLILGIVRAVGVYSARVGVVAVLTSFAVARLAGSVPVTPGGLGTIDSAFVGMLAAFGTSTSRALSADLVWRLSTYLVPILLGIVTYLIWVVRERRGRPDGENVVPSS